MRRRGRGEERQQHSVRGYGRYRPRGGEEQEACLCGFRTGLVHVSHVGSNVDAERTGVPEFWYT